MSPDDAYGWVRSHFERHSLNASDEWMRACVDWFLTNEATNLNRLRLVEGVRKQWLDCDIRKPDVQRGPGLEPNTVGKGQLKSAAPLQGTFVLQVLTAVDVTKPAYSQLQDLKKEDTQNLEVTSDRTQAKTWAPPPPSRCLKMVLTDGFSNVDALEFEPCPTELPDPVPCGLKVAVKGPLDVRRGVLLLRPANIKCLGGQVDPGEMEKGESLAGELAKRLEQQSLNDTANPSLPPSRYTRPPNAAEMIKYKRSPKKPRPFKREVKKEDVKANPFEDDDDDVFSHIPDEAMKMDDADDSLFSSIEMPEEASRPSPEKVKVEVDSQQPVKVKVEVKSQESVRVEVAPAAKQPVAKRQLLEAATKPSTSSKKSKTTDDVSGLVKGKPFQYLSTVKSCGGDGVYTVKACFVTLTGKLSTAKKRSSTGGESRRVWTLPAVITDGSDTVGVTLSPDLLEKWLGTSVEQVSAMDQAGKSQFKVKLKEVLSDKMLTMNALMKLKVRPNSVEVMDTVALNRGHAQQLKVRNSKI